MALVASGVRVHTRRLAMGVRVVTGTLAFDSSYPTGGEAITPSTAFGLSEVHGVLFGNQGGYTFAYDYVNNKVLAYTTAGTEVVNATDLSALNNVKFIALGW